MTSTSVAMATKTTVAAETPVSCMDIAVDTQMTTDGRHSFHLVYNTGVNPTAVLGHAVAGFCDAFK